MLPSGIGRPPLACDGSMLRASFRLCYAAQRLFLLSILLLLPSWPANVEAMRPSRRETLKQATIEMFYHGFDNYMSHAFPEDELRPVSCVPLTRDANNPGNIELNDVLGNYSLTLIDSLSTLAILASAPPDDRDTGPEALRDFQDGVAALVEQYGDGHPGPSGRGLRGRGFDVDSKVQVFETVIRGVGGLLSAHLFAIGELPITGYDIGGSWDESHPISWPNGLKYDGQLLRLALDLAQRLLPAFYSATGMPYPRVNLRHGIPFYQNSPLHDGEGESVGTSAEGPPEITETCSAGAGSLVLEFTVLSRLTGDARFEQLAKRAFWAVWYRKSQIGLIGAGVDAEHGQWIGAYSVVGAGADSFFEYALKTHILLSGHELPNRTTSQPALTDDWLDPNTLFPPLSEEENLPESFLEAWHHAHAAIKRHLYEERDHPHYVNVNLWTGSLVSHWVDSLGAYYSGLLALAGELDEAIETNLLYTAIWTRYSALPERWSVKDKAVEGGLGWWPLRPEFIESTYHLYRATKDPWYLYVGEMVQRDIKRRCWTPCGWAGLQNVLDGEKSDRMESFFLGETAKYMYLLFDDTHPLNSLDAAYVFTTEGHPLIIPRKKGGPTKPVSSSGSTDISVYFDEGFTISCPPPPKVSPLTGSVTAARPDLYHAARMLDLHLVPNLSSRFDTGSTPSQMAPKSNYTFYPWTLPTEMLPGNGTCDKIHQPFELTLEFASNAQQVVGGSAFNFLLGTQTLERLSADKIRVTGLSGLKIMMRLEEEDDERDWRIIKVNGVPLGRDEYVVMDRSILGEVSDPRFNLVRDPSLVKIHHLHRVDLTQNETSVASGSQSGQRNEKDDAQEDMNREELDDDARRYTSAQSRITEFMKSLFRRMVSSLDLPSPTGHAATTLPFPYNLVLNQTGITAVGIGAAPLPAADIPPGSHIPAYGVVAPHVLPWSTVFAAGDACTRLLPEEAARAHQVVIVRRGGCSFSSKLENIPSFTPSSRALQLVVIVSDNDPETGDLFEHFYSRSGFGHHYDYGASRPLLDRVQLTPAGLERRHPIAMVMVGGGDVTYHQLAMAERVGITRKYYIESQGMRVRNLIVDDGDAGSMF